MLDFSLRKKFDSFSLDASLSIENEIAVLLAPSGGGKSLTLNLISGIVKPDSGKITLNESTLYDSNKNISLPIRKRGIGYIFQDYSLFPNKTVRDNIEFGMPSSNNHDVQIKKILEKFDLTDKEHTFPHHLSGGQKQRVAIARALAAKSRVMLFDEPLSAIDVPLRESLIRFISEIPRTFELPVLYVTHNFIIADSIANKIAVMNNGSIVEFDAKDRVLQKPEYYFTAQFLGIKNLFPCIMSGSNGKTGTVNLFDRFEISISNVTEYERSTPIWLGIHSSDVRLLITDEDRPNMFQVYVESMYITNRMYNVSLQVIEDGKPVEGFRLYMEIEELTCIKYKLSLHDSVKVSLKPDRLFLCRE